MLVFMKEFESSLTFMYNWSGYFLVVIKLQAQTMQTQQPHSR